jgi:heparin/heparan-sulfate lyase
VKQPGFKKVWQINTLQPPEPTAGGVRFRNAVGGRTGKLDVQLLVPAIEERTTEVLSGSDVHRVAGRTFTPPTPAAPEANGHRYVVTPKQARTHDRFVSVLQACEDNPLPVAHEENDEVVIIRIADRVVAIAKGTELVARAFEVTVPSDGTGRQVLLAGLQPGSWQILTRGAPDRSGVVEAGRNTFSFESRGGRHRITPR